MTDLLSLDGKELEKELARIVKSNPKGYRFWTPKEEVVLRRLYGRTDPKVIAEVLGRSRQAIHEQAQRLGLKA